MKTKTIVKYAFFCLTLPGLTACSDFFEPDNETVLRTDDYISEPSEIYAGYAGVLSKLQMAAENPIYLLDTRAEAFVPTDRETSLISLSNYDDDVTGNPFADPAKFYDIIIACNDYLHKVKAFKDAHPSDVDMEAYKALVAGCVRIKVWTYFTLAKIYNQVVWFDDPMVTMVDFSQFPKYDLDGTIDACVDLLATGFDGIPADADTSFSWDEYFRTDIDEETVGKGTYTYWDRATPQYFVVAAELALWKEEWQKVVDLIMTAINEQAAPFIIDNPKSSTTPWICSAGYNGAYGRTFRRTDFNTTTGVTGMRYQFLKDQTHTLSKYFYSEKSILPTEVAIERFSDPDFNPIKAGKKDRRYNQGWREVSGTMVLQKYTGSDNTLYLYRNAELYLMLMEAYNHLGKYYEMDALMNVGADWYKTNEPEIYEANFKDFTNSWVKGLPGSPVYPCDGLRGSDSGALNHREIDMSGTPEGMYANDMGLLKEYVLEFPGEGKTLPAMIRMARRYNDNTIISDLVCGKYAGEDQAYNAAVAASIKAKIDAGDYFVKWDINSATAK